MEYLRNRLPSVIIRKTHFCFIRIFISLKISEVAKMIAGYITCIVFALIFVFMGYLTHIKKKLWLIAGYQEESFFGG